MDRIFLQGPFRRLGGDLLSHTLRCSTISAKRFHGRVRDGIGWFTLAITTKSSKRTLKDIYQFCLHSYFPLKAIKPFQCYGFSPAHEGIFKPIEQLVPVSYTHCCASTPGLSTWWSSTVLKGELVLRWVSRLDAFSGYPVQT